MPYVIVYHGKWVSWNTMLSMNRWQRAKLLKEWEPIYVQMFRGAGIIPMESFRIDVRYWSKMDSDNLYFKKFIDTLRSEKLVINDDKRYFGGISYQTDASLKHNQYVITITPTTVEKKK